MYARDRVLVHFRPSVAKTRRQSVHASVHANVVRGYGSIPGLELVRIAADSSVEATLRQYRSNPAVLYAEPDYLVSIHVEPNDARFSELWGLHNTGQEGGTAGADIHAPQAWAITTGSSSVVVGVIDTGVDYTHPDLSGNIWNNPGDCDGNGADDDGNGYIDDCHGIDAVNGDSDPMDDHDHGTHVAGTIGAVGNNELGVVGVNWQVKIIACKFLDAAGRGFDSDAITCFDYFVTLKNRGVNLVALNNSWGGHGRSQALEEAAGRLRDAGVLIIASAGNESSSNDGLDVHPATLPLDNVVAVAATDRHDQMAGFSNYGPASVHLGAPGVSILSTLPNAEYGNFSGTSMAAPHVTGVAALLKAAEPSLDYRAIRWRLMVGGDEISALADTISSRRLNAYGALTCNNRVLRRRMHPVGSSSTARAGVPMLLQALHLSCTGAAGGFSVSVAPENTTVVLHDDGVAPDALAGDGIYSANWTPPHEGTFTLDFGDGQPVAVQTVTPYHYTLVPLQYRDIAGTVLEVGDDGVQQVTTPFPIHFGGISFTSLYVSANGAVSFTHPVSDSEPRPLPLPHAATLVTPFWYDLAPQQAGQLRWEVAGTAPQRELVIRWAGIPHDGCPTASNGIDVEVVFFEANSDVLFNYLDTSFDCGGGDARMGIQISEAEATQYTEQVPTLMAGKALLWQLGPQPPQLDVIDPFGKRPGDPAFTLLAEGKNFYLDSVVRWNGEDRPTTFVNPTTLRAAISATDLADPAENQVAVFTPNGGVSPSRKFLVAAENPVPFLNDMSYPFIVAGMENFLTQNGGNFVADSVMYWNGQPRDTIVVSDTELRGLVTYEDVAAAGTGEITVFNPLPGGGFSNPTSVNIRQWPPQVSSVSDTTLPRGLPGMTLRINGSGLAKATVARWDGVDRVTRYDPPEFLEMDLLPEDLATVGTHNIVVWNPSSADGWGGTSQPVTVEVGERPRNDDVVNATLVADSIVNDQPDTRFATREATDPAPLCVRSPGPSVWYRISGRSGPFVIDTTGSSLGAVISVWSGTPGYWQAVQLCSERGIKARREILSFMADAQTDYYVQVSSVPSGGGPLVVNIRQENPVPSILSVTPQFAVGGAPIELTVKGFGFVPGSTLRTSEQSFPTTYVSWTEVKALLDPGTNGCMLYWLNVENPAPGGGWDPLGLKLFTLTGFRLAGPPPTELQLTVAPGGSKSHPITIESCYGNFAGEVLLTCSTTAPGVTCGFSPSSGVPGVSGFTSIMTVTRATFSTASGTLLAMAVSGAIQTGWGLTVPPILELSLVRPHRPSRLVTGQAGTAAPGKEQVVVSRSAPAQWKLNLSMPLAVIPVALTCTAPRGTHCTLEPERVEPNENGGEITVNVTADADTAPGPRSVRIEATSGSHTRSIVLPFIVKAAGQPAPQ